MYETLSFPSKGEYLYKLDGTKEFLYSIAFPHPSFEPIFENTCKSIFSAKFLYSENTEALTYAAQRFA
jgi:hypothetical protein